MPIADYADLTPEELYSCFTDLRHHLNKTDEARFDHSQSEQRHQSWMEHRPKELDRKVIETLGLSMGDIERNSEKTREARRVYMDENEAKKTRLQPDTSLGLHAMPLPRTKPCFPYAVSKVGTTKHALESYDGEGTGNPDAWKILGFEARQPLELRLRGEGTGLYDFSLAPECTTHDGGSVHWFFLNVPFGDGAWSCSAKPQFHGEYSVWSDDGFFSSTYARARFGASLTLVPFGNPQPLIHLLQRTSTEVFNLGGQNVNDWRQDTWVAPLAKLAPHPGYENRPHWIVVSAWGTVSVRGDAYAHLVFDRNWSQSGPYPDGSYKTTKWGIYCDTTKIHW